MFVFIQVPCPLFPLIAACTRQTGRAGASSPGLSPTLAAPLQPLRPPGPRTRLPYGEAVPRHPLACLTRRASPWPGRLLACLLSALLLAAVHCSSYLLSDGHEYAPTPVAAGEPAQSSEPDEADAAGHPHHHHPHGSVCTLTGLNPQAQSGRQLPVGAAPLPPLASAPVVLAGGLLPAPRRTSRVLIAQSGRSTLTSVCRWRI
jgi:hypothetical protein